MFRAVLVPFLIAGLLTCPLRCTVAACGGERSEESATAGTFCSCCADESLDSAESCNTPSERPDDECTCGSCICHGAVSEHEDASLLAAPHDVVAEVCPVAPANSPQLALLARVGTAADCSRYGYYVDGREARIVHQSLQI